MTDHANEIRDALMWAQAYAPDRLAHRLIDAEESLRELLAAHAAEVEQLRQERDRVADVYVIRLRVSEELEDELVEARADAETLRQQLAAAIEQDYCTLCGTSLAAAQEPPAAPCYVCGHPVAEGEGRRRDSKTWCPDHRPVWSHD